MSTIPCRHCRGILVRHFLAGRSRDRITTFSRLRAETPALSSARAWSTVNASIEAARSNPGNHRNLRKGRIRKRDADVQSRNMHESPLAFCAAGTRQRNVEAPGVPLAGRTARQQLFTASRIDGDGSAMRATVDSGSLPSSFETPSDFLRSGPSAAAVAVRAIPSVWRRQWTAR
jgi:hypothetical protein